MCCFLQKNMLRTSGGLSLHPKIEQAYSLVPTFFCSDETLFPNIVKYCTIRKIIFPFHVLFLKNIYVEDQWWILFTPNNKKLSCF